MSAPDKTEHRSGGPAGAGGMAFALPSANDGIRLWELARDSQVLDLNSSYAYLLWCRDFADTSAVAKVDGRVVGFVTGFLRPSAPDTLLVWQVAVDEGQRGQRLASRMLHHLLDRLIPRGVRWLETTVTPDNVASIRLFTAVARDRDAPIERSDLFAAQDFPEGHEAEDLYRIGPLDVRDR